MKTKKDYLEELEKMQIEGFSTAVTYHWLANILTEVAEGVPEIYMEYSEESAYSTSSEEIIKWRTTFLGKS